MTQAQCSSRIVRSIVAYSDRTHLPAQYPPARCKRFMSCSGQGFKRYVIDTKLHGTGRGNFKSWFHWLCLTVTQPQTLRHLLRPLLSHRARGTSTTRTRPRKQPGSDGKRRFSVLGTDTRSDSHTRTQQARIHATPPGLNVSDLYFGFKLAPRLPKNAA